MKLKLFASVFVFCFSFSLNAYNSAHVIAVSEHNGDQYVLFGQMKNSSVLSTFGGLRDPGEMDPKSTAAREAEEEALGVIGTQNQVRTRLKGIKASCGFNNGHLCYVLPSKNYGKSLPYRFRQIRFHSADKLSHSQLEMVDIVAVRVDEIKSKIHQNAPLTFYDNQGVKRKLRGSSEGSIKAAVKAGHL